MSLSQFPLILENTTIAMIQGTAAPYGGVAQHCVNEDDGERGVRGGEGSWRGDLERGVRGGEGRGREREEGGGEAR